MPPIQTTDLTEITHQGPVRQPKGATVVFGGQAGSEGKGAIAAYLAKKYEWGASVCTFMPNAGHTYVGDDGEVVVSQLPLALVSPSVKRLVIGPGSAIDVEKLLDEIDKYDATYDVVSRLVIDPRAVIVTEEHQEWEREHLSYIASTAKGCGAALASKIRREQDVRLARDEDALAPFISNRPTPLILNDVINGGHAVLVEQSQGFDLDVHHGVAYPYCTSRGCTPMQIMADIGVSESLVTHRIAVVRTQPIRVGNVEGGESGPYGSEETDWQEVSKRAGREVEERTTVTKRVRRVFEMDFDRLAEMSSICRPTEIALTFADYLDERIYGLTQERFQEEYGGNYFSLSEKLHHFLYELKQAMTRPTSTYMPITIIKTGPHNDHMMVDAFRV